MRTIKCSITAVLIALLSTSGWIGTAKAEDGGYRNYGLLRTGFNDFTDDLDEADYGAGVNVGVSYGRYLTPHLVAEVGADMFGTDSDMNGSTPSAGRYSREDSIAVIAVLTTLKGEVAAGPLVFFAGGGAGVYFLALSADIETDHLGDLDESDSDTVLGVHAVAGVHYNITERFFAGLQGMYRWTDDIDIDETIASVPVVLEGDLDGYTVTLAAGFRF